MYIYNIKYTFVLLLGDVIMKKAFALSLCAIMILTFTLVAF